MPHYYFDVFADGLTPDDTGLELPDMEIAQKEATRMLIAVAGEMVQDGEAQPDASVRIRDETGSQKRTVALRILVLS